MRSEEYMRGYVAGVIAGHAFAGALAGEAPVERPPARAKRPAAGRPAGTGTRQQAILDTLKQCGEQDPTPPTTPELAEVMGSDPKYLYRALPILLKQGKVRCWTTTAEGEEGSLEPGTDVEGQRHLLGVMPRWSLAG